MGFWSAVGSFLKEAAKKAEEFNRKVEEKASSLRNKSDEKLAILYIKRDSTVIEKAAAAKVLKERGYDPEEIKRLIIDYAQLKKTEKELAELEKELDKLIN